MKGISIIIPAAGASARMRGRDKLLQRVDGMALLRRQVLRALDTGLPVIVTLPPLAEARRAALAGLDMQIVTVPKAAEGLSASLKAGAGFADKSHALMILLPDMPEIETSDINRLIVAHKAQPDRVLRASTKDGRLGHPVVLPARLRSLMSDLSGDAGAKRLFAHEQIVPVALPDNRAITDLDRPEDWAAWRARQDK